MHKAAHAHPTRAPNRAVYLTTTPQEDFYLSAGAPGYTEDRSVAAPAAAGAASQPPTRPPADPGSAHLAAAVRAAEEAARWAPLPLVRHASGSVLLGNLSSFVRTYELLVLPAYAAADGCVSARLLVAELPPGASRASLMAAAAGAGRAAEVAVASVTTWRDAAAMEAAQASPAYASAMFQLRTLFRRPPTEVASWAEVAGMQRGGADNPQPGAELGLR